MMIVSEPSEAKVDVREGDTRLEDLGLTEGELALVKVKHYKSADEFTQALFHAITHADATDLEKLQSVYPSHLDAYRNYKIVPGWYENLVTRLPQRRQSDN